MQLRTYHTMKPFIFLIIIIVVSASCRKDSIPVSQLSKLSSERTSLPPPEPLKFKNVVILGNSITFTPANPFGEWKGNWGMAASAADSDYVHRLAVNFRKLAPDCKVTARNIAEFELDYVDYNFDAGLMDLRDSIPDLLILRIGEDVDPVKYDVDVFRSRYEALVNYFLSKNSKLMVLGVGPLWNAYMLKPVMQYTPYVSLAHINEDRSNCSFGLFITPGIQVHPSDKGMRAISDSIWKGVTRLKPAS